MKKQILLTLSTGVWLAAHTALASGPANSNGTVLKPNLEGFNKGTNMRYVVDGTNVVITPNSGVSAPTARTAAVEVADTNAAPIAGATNAAPDTNAVAATNAPPSDQPPTVANQTPQPGDQPAHAPVGSTNTSSVVTMKNGEKGLLLNFRGVPLETVLNFMSDAAGFIIHPKVDVSGKVTVWSAQPVSKEEAVTLLKQMLNENGYTAIQEDRTLTILRADEAGKNEGVPVRMGKDPKLIPRNAIIVTQIIPVRSLNVVQLVKNLQPLLPSNATMTADESANSIMLTDTQANIHRIAEIIDALDSVTTGNSTIQVFPLRYADSKTIATLIKDLFPAPEAAGQNGSSRGSSFGRMRGMMSAMMSGGGPPSGESGGSSGEGGSGHTPTAKVNAVSDDHSNSLIVSAPDELMPTIAQLVKEVDTAVEDTTVAKTFHLKNADPGEMAELLTALFPDDSSSQTDASRQGFRGFGFGFPGMTTPSRNSNSQGESDRMKKLARVVAVADRRTASLIVTAGTNAMVQIESIITELDARTDRKLTPHVISLGNADPVDVQTILQSLFPSTSGSPTSSSLSSAQNNPLYDRQKTILQQQNSTTTSSFGSSTGGGSRTGTGL